jgi:hypothetical protein
MSKTVITTILTNSVTLGTPGYGNNLTITATGGIDPTQAGATALYAPAGLKSVSITNQGGITGGLGASAQYTGGTGGMGVDMAGGGLLTNTGTIAGGAGGAATRDGQNSKATYTGGNGGAGILIDGTATVDNSGVILGGPPAPSPVCPQV